MNKSFQIMLDWAQISGDLKVEFSWIVSKSLQKRMVFFLTLLTWSIIQHLGRWEEIQEIFWRNFVY